MSRSHILIWVFCASLALPSILRAQTPPTVSRPPEAQEALNKGVIAAQAQDYLLAIRYFQDARKAAPSDPLIFLNLGLAESKIPGRELRAIAWFAAYLAASPNASNAAAVRDQIIKLDVKSQSNLNHLIEVAQAAASRIGKFIPEGDQLERMADLSALSGDFASALKTADKIQGIDTIDHIGALLDIAVLQAQVGADDDAQANFAAALKIANQVEDEDTSDFGHTIVVRAQAIAGYIEQANQVARFIQEPHEKFGAEISIAEAEAMAGDFPGAAQSLASARKSADEIKDQSFKAEALQSIFKVQFEINSMKSSSIPVGILVWLRMLDDEDATNDCALNTDTFLDLVGKQSSRSSSEPWYVVETLVDDAETLGHAQFAIERLLKKQTAK